MTADALLEARDLRKYFPVRGGILNRVSAEVKAVDGVSFTVRRGEILGLVGESGSGKSTVGKTIVRLLTPTEGEIRFDGVDVTHLAAAELKAFRRRTQMIFQDPFSSLNPRMRVGDILGEASIIHGLHAGRAARQARVAELLDLVGLSPNHAQRYPHEFSGGQRQRIGIARALSVDPEFIVADEAVSALDVSIQAQIINLLEDLKERLGLTLLFIAHDLAVVQHLCDRIAVMYLGRMVEVADSDTLFQNPRHPYTRALLSAIPSHDPDASGARQILQGDIPSPISPPSGCVFRTRCPYAMPRCAELTPALEEVEPGHSKACIRDDL